MQTDTERFVQDFRLSVAEGMDIQTRSNMELTAALTEFHSSEEKAAFEEGRILGAFTAGMLLAVGAHNQIILKSLDQAITFASAGVRGDRQMKANSLPSIP